MQSPVTKIPEHVAIVMDESATSISAAAIRTARMVGLFAQKSGVRFLTLAFENAPAQSTADIAADFNRSLHKATDELTRRGLRLQIVQKSGRSDIVHAVRELAAQVKSGRLRPEDLDSERLAKTLSTADFPELDLIILCGRTAKGQQKPHLLTGSLFYESAYAEFFFCAAPWVLFSAADFQQALEDFALRERRFGRTMAVTSAQGPSPRWAGSTAGTGTTSLSPQ